jgi:hypothetical protein
MKSAGALRLPWAKGGAHKLFLQTPHSWAALTLRLNPVTVNSGKPYGPLFTSNHGPFIAEAVSHRLHAAATWVRAQVRSWEIYGGQRAGFLRVLPLPLHADRYKSPAAGTIGQIVNDVLWGISLTPSQETKKEIWMLSWTFAAVAMKKPV